MPPKRPAWVRVPLSAPTYSFNLFQIVPKPRRHIAFKSISCFNAFQAVSNSAVFFAVWVTADRTYRKVDTAMPKLVVPLNDAQIKKAKPADKPFKMFDGSGLYLLIDKNGGKFWRFDYTRPVVKKRNTIALGEYPEVTLADARRKRDELRKQINQGTDPSEEKKRIAAEKILEHNATFKAVAEDWLKRQNYAPASINKATRLLSYAYLAFGDRPISALNPRDILAVCRKLEDRGVLETAREVKIKCGQVMRYGVAIGVCERDMTQDLRGALQTPVVTHRAAVVEPIAFGRLLSDIDHYDGKLTTQIALKIAPLVFVRPGELRMAKWADIDFDKKLWCYTPPKTKRQTGIEHVVPLSRQVVDLLQSLRPYTQHSEYVFPALHTIVKPMSENTINQAIRRLGYASDEMCGHGFRAAARTILEEVLNYPIEIIEQQLAHVVKDMHGRAYNRTKHIDKRTEMMQAWADYLDTLKTGQ